MAYHKKFRILGREIKVSLSDGVYNAVVKCARSLECSPRELLTKIFNRKGISDFRETNERAVLDFIRRESQELLASFKSAGKHCLWGHSSLHQEGKH